ncbi:MAG: glycosyltransferase family 2 protein [Bacteroides sp.]|nr:glycosyltransferase family 2 protein [Roseburia sp.]MCM1346011.1 glycosyltransferase family 2 protein [Bacteroides sp.]MCM1421477.1 glycosyltransferase family 2 protein [Bacteroides sp.]
MKVSVIIPIYNVRQYIQRCACSLFEQTLSDIEYIFIDDSTPDDSIEILYDVITKYPKRSSQVTIVHHTENKGLPAARNSGLEIATGEYIFHCDSDDFVEKDMLEIMYMEAKKQDADIVWCDYFLSYVQNERYMKQPDFVSASEALDSILCGEMKYNVWNKLVRHSLYTNNQIFFPDGYGMGEDMTMIHLFACANVVAYVSRAFYHYVKVNDSSFCQTYSEKHLMDLKYNTERTMSFLRKKFGSGKELQIAFFLLDVKYPFLISDKRNDYNIWREWHSEANKYIGLNKRSSKRALLIQRLAYLEQYWLIRLYYKFVYRLIYPLIYK